jgi:transcriptional regulator of arginine metabolism
MKAKKARHLAIKNLIKNNRVTNQDELATLLEKQGIYAAQATLSRDITELHISKVHDANGIVYRLPENEYADNILSGTSVLTSSIASLEFSGSLAIMKTLPGHANMIASLIDGASFKSIIGTIAGDDTILVIAREGKTQKDVVEELEKMFEGLDKLIIK